MSPELIAIIGVGAAILAAVIAQGALMVNLIGHSERRLNQRFDAQERRLLELEERLRELEKGQTEINQKLERIQSETNRLQSEINRLQSEMNQLRADMNRRFDAQEERIRGLEQGQAYLSGQFSALKDFFTHQSDSE